MANFFDKIGNWMSESSMSNISGEQYQVLRALKGFTAVDTLVGGNYIPTANPKKQLEQQAIWTLVDRNEVFNSIDLIANNHLANTIKDIIVSDGFNDLCGGETVTIKYTDDDNVEKAELFNKSIKMMLKRTNLVNILQDCIVNEGLDYGEIFLSTQCEYGKGLISVSDDLNLRELLAVYKNSEFVGGLEFQINGKKDIQAKKFIPADYLAHFMLNYKKVSVKISKGFNKFYKTAEKIRCAKPILADVVELIIQYNILEKIRTAIEINKATQPVFLGIGVSPDQDMTQISQNLQDWSNVLNKNKNNIINSLDSLDVSSILQSMQQIELVPYSQDEGTNTMKQIAVRYNDSNLTDKINDLRKTIALAVGVPESYLSTTTYLGARDNKEDSLLTNPRYSRMLSRIQQLVAKGIRDLVFKHLIYKFSTEDGIQTRSVEKDKIVVLFNSATNLNDRLEDENMLVNAETMGSLLQVIDTIGTSQNIHVKVDENKFLEMWKKQMFQTPDVRDVLIAMTPEEIEAEKALLNANAGIGNNNDNDDYNEGEAEEVQDDQEIEDDTDTEPKSQNLSSTPKRKPEKEPEKKDIRDVGL